MTPSAKPVPPLTLVQHLLVDKDDQGVMLLADECEWQRCK